jgi:hypothetical protein
MRRRSKAGTSRQGSVAGSGGRRRRFAVARRAEELAVALGMRVRRGKARRRPVKTELGGKTRTRSSNAYTRGIRGSKITRRGGRKIGLGRKRVRPA